MNAAPVRIADPLREVQPLTLAGLNSLTGREKYIAAPLVKLRAKAAAIPLLLSFDVDEAPTASGRILGFSGAGDGEGDDAEASAQN